MPSPEEINAAGPWAVLVFFLAAGIVGLFAAFAKEIIVPGGTHRRLRADFDEVKTQGDRNAKALETAAEAAKAAAKAAESRDKAYRATVETLKAMVADRERDRTGTNGGA